ncbi:MAG: OmpH family outer membrane protein [Planctomycetes bacterium]|nr:OmpH family outer membrane protein [Planctomycetota bacterium]
MSRFRLPVTSLLTACALSLGALPLVTPATAVAQVAARAVKVGTIDLNKVLDQMDEKTFRERQLETFLKNLEDSVNEIAKQLKQAKSELDILPKNGPAYLAKREEVLRLTARVQAEAQAAKILAEDKKKVMQIDLYEKISDSTKEFAKKNGYDLILVDDSKEKIPQDASPQQAQAAMISKRLMFAASDIDVSDMVAQQMNNEFKATGMGGSGAAPAPAEKKPN